MSADFGDLLDVELEAELELLREDRTLHEGADADINVNDIYSSSEGDFNLFAFKAGQDDDAPEQDGNECIWQSYFDHMAENEERCTKESQHILSSMKLSCAETLKICSTRQKAKLDEEEEVDFGAAEETKEYELNLIASTITSSVIHSPHTAVAVCTSDDTITRDPCVPTHVACIESPSKTRSPELPPSPAPNMASLHALALHVPMEQQELKDDEVLQSQQSLKPQDDEEDEYQQELQKLEAALEVSKRLPFGSSHFTLLSVTQEATQAHHEEVETDTTFDWTSLMTESKELYDEYIETQRKMLRDHQHLVMLQAFSEWKSQWARTKREQQRLREVTQSMQRIVMHLVNKTVIRYHPHHAPHRPLQT